MDLDLNAVLSAITNPDEECSLKSEELAVLAQMVLLSEPHGYFVNHEKYLKWEYQGLVRYIFLDLYKDTLLRGVDVVEQILDASYYYRLHRTVRREGAIQLTPPKESSALQGLDIYQSRHASLLALLRETPLYASFISSYDEMTPASVSDIVRFCVHLSPEERAVVKWMTEAVDSPIMQLMTRFGYMAEERRLTITDMLSDPFQMSQFEAGSDKTYRRFIRLYQSLSISDEENALLIFIGKSKHLADLGRRIVRLSGERRAMISRML